MNSKTVILTILIQLTILVGTVKSQSNKAIDLSGAFKVGDTFVPPETVKLMRGSLKTIDWKALKDKVVILDFFDTFCGTCIAIMPELQKLQDTYPDKVQIFNVGWQDKETLDKFFANNSFLKEHKVNLSVIYADTYLKNHFPHSGAPHVVFLYQGKVQAITFFRQVTAENILNLFEKGTIKLPFKNDFGTIDLSEERNTVKNLKMSVLVTGYQDGVPAEAFSTKQDSVTGQFKTSIINRSIFRSIISTTTRIKKSPFYIREDRVVWKVNDPKKYKDVDEVGEAWLNENAICYERIDLQRKPDSVLARLVLDDLHKLFGLRSYYSTKTMKSLVLKRSAIRKSTAPANGKGPIYENSGVLAGFIDFSNLFPPAVDLVKSKERIQISSFNNLEELNDQLGPYGIEAVIEDQNIGVFVVEELNQ